MTIIADSGSKTQATQPSTLRALLRLRSFVGPALPRLGAGLASAIAAAVIALMIPIALERVISGPIAGGDTWAIVWGSILILALGLAEAFLVWVRRAFVLSPAIGVEFRMRTALYARLQRLPIAFHDRWQSGQLLSRMMQDINLIRRWLTFALILLFVNIATIGIGAVLLFRWHWFLGTIFLCTAIPLSVIGYRFEKSYGTLTRRSQDQVGDLATSVEESVHGIRVLKAFGRGRFALGKFAQQAQTLRQTEMLKAKAVGWLWFWLVVLPQLAFGFSLVAGIWLITQDQLTVAELVAFFAMVTVLRWPIESIGFLFSFLMDARGATDRVFEIFDTKNTITSPAEPRPLRKSEGRLAFEDVVFRFADTPAGHPSVLDGVSLVLEPGETMALVGLTGSGKSTLTTLPTRLREVTGGRITLDGVDVRELSLVDLRREIAMAFEEATLFSATVRENVLLGRDELDPESAAAEQVLRSALAVAQADFVDALPAGTQTIIGEEGLSLSGGQRQRLALARAVAAAPRVLILDDPLSALDVDTEALVEEALRHVLQGTTALIVAHRPSTVALADRVAVLEDGKISAVGTHAELLRSSEHYRYVISSLDSGAGGFDD